MNYATAFITQMNPQGAYDWYVVGSWYWGQGVVSDSGGFNFTIALGSMPAQIHQAVREAVAAAILAADSETIDPEIVFIIGGIQ